MNIHIHGMSGKKPVGETERKGIVLSDEGRTLDLGDGEEEETPLQSAEVTPEAPGRYEIRRKIGCGGIGHILLAFDRHVGRTVALKEILPHLLPDKDSGGKTPKSHSRTVRSRFLREARVTGQLEHPSIVPVYEIGQRPDGSLYYTMRLVEGETLASAIAKSLDLAERLTLLPHFYNLCNAIAYAHSRGVLHRDIKPENVMIGPFGETVVLDWGLAKVRGERDHSVRHLERHLSLIREVDIEKTMSGRVVGTPAYMPPEQARGELERLDERSDVYALGAVLYEILTGRRPFEGDTAYEILDRVIKGNPLSIRQWEPDAPPELVAIAERAMRKRQEERYPSAAEMITDIKNYLAGGKVSAHRYSILELLRKFFYTNRTIAVSSLVALLLVIIGAVIISREYLLSQESLAVSRSFLYAERSREYEKVKNYGAAALLAAAALLHNPAAAGNLVSLPGLEKRHPEVFPLYATIHSRLYQAGLGLQVRFEKIISSPGTVWAIAFSPDGRTIAVGGHAKEQRIIALYDRATGTLRGELRGITGNVHAIAFSPDGKTIAAATQGHRLLLWDTDSLQQSAGLAGSDSALFAVAFSPDGSKVAAAGLDGFLRVWQVKEKRLVFETEAHREGALCLAFSPDGATVASGGWDRRVAVWDARKGTLLRTMEDHRDAVSAIAFSPDGRRLVSGGHDRTMIFWNLVTGDRRAIHGHGGAITALSYTQNGHYLASAGDDNAVKIWDANTGELVLRMEVHRKTVTAVSFYADDLLATGGNDRFLRLWKLSPGRTVTGFHGHAAPVSAISLLPRDEALLSIGEDNTLRFWDAVTGLEILQLDTPAGPRALAVSRDGMLIAVGGWDRRIRLWRKGEIRPIADFADHTDTVRAIDFSSDGRMLLSAGDDAMVCVRNLVGGAVVKRMSGHYGATTAVSFLDRGERYATGGVDGVVFIRDSETGKEIARVEAGGTVRVLRLLDAGRVMLFVGEMPFVIRYDLTHGTLLTPIEIGSRGITDMVVSPDAQVVGVVGENGVVTIFSLPDGHPRLSLDTEAGRVVLFNAAGDSLFLSDGLTIRRYPVERFFVSGDPLRFFEETRCATGLTLFGAAVEPLEKPCQ